MYSDSTDYFLLHHRLPPLETIAEPLDSSRPEPLETPSISTGGVVVQKFRSTAISLRPLYACGVTLSQFKITHLTPHKRPHNLDFARLDLAGRRVETQLSIPLLTKAL